MLEGVTWFQQSAMRLRGNGLTVCVDPWGTCASDELADVVFITHAHFDHFHAGEIEQLRKPPSPVQRFCRALLPAPAPTQVPTTKVAWFLGFPRFALPVVSTRLTRIGERTLRMRWECAFSRGG